MAPRNRNRNNNRRMPSRATTAAAPAPVQQAPMDPMFVQNRFDKGATYIPGLYQPGMRGYDAQYGGGGWARLGTGTTADQLKAKLASDFAAGRMVTSPTNPEPGQSPETQATSQKSYKDIKSIGGGLKLGGDNILGRREAMKIARGTGRDFDKVLTKALGQGMSIGGGAVRQSNEAAGTSQLTPTIKGQQMFTSGGSDDPLSAMRRVTPGKRQMYSGTYELDGQTMPLIESRRGGVASTLGGMTAGGGGRRRGGKGKGRGSRGRGGAGDMESTGMETSQTPMTPMEPMTPEQMQEESSININMPGVGEDVFSSATGFRSKRSSRKRAGRQAASLASQRINPTGSWRYGV